MDMDSSRTAVIVGASSGIGEALAHQLNREGWRLGLLARRLDRLEALRQTLGPDSIVRRIDVTHDDAAAILDEVLDQLGGVDLVIISAGGGHNNRDLNVELDVDTVTLNVLAFMKTAQVAVRHFLKRGRGHEARAQGFPDTDPVLDVQLTGPPTNPLLRVKQDDRKRIYRRIASCAGGAVHIAQCRDDLRRQFQLSPEDVAQIEAEGLERRWPPAEPMMRDKKPLVDAALALCREPIR